jgi:hypothetical protein
MLSNPVGAWMFCAWPSKPECLGLINGLMNGLNNLGRPPTPSEVKRQLRDLETRQTSATLLPWTISRSAIHCFSPRRLGQRRILRLELTDDLYYCGEAFGYGRVAGSFHGEVPGPVWPDGDFQSPWTDVRGPRQSGCSRSIQQPIDGLLIPSIVKQAIN